jgi:hypothetical protein
MMREDSTLKRDALLISGIIHIIIAIILSSYITVTSRPPEGISVTWVKAPEPEIKIERPLINENLFKKYDTERKTGPKVRSTNEIRSSDFAQAVAPSPDIIRKSVEINPNALKTKIMPDVITQTKIGRANDIPFSGPITTATGAKVGRGAITGLVRAGGQGSKRGLSILDTNMASDAGVDLDMLKSPTSLQNDQIGGILIGQGSDISGHIRLIRLKHGLSDWWQDATALTGLVDWLNKNTRIHADMQVAGGTLALDDPAIFSAPVVFMTGHDRIVTESRNLMQPDQRSGKLMAGLTNAEKAGLREYLVDRGGMLFFDDCGFNGLFADEVKTLLREALPEYSLDTIPKTHEIFKCYYNLPGPPRGSEMFWGSENEGKGMVFPVLQGMFIGTRLAVVYSRKDYLCAIETVEIPSHTQLRYRYSPDVYKFMTNLVVYAMKYGGITDRSDYN